MDNTEPKFAASLNPENMTEGGGLPDNFDGELVRARYIASNYDGKIPRYTLAVSLDFLPDEDSGLQPFTQLVSAGDLKNFVPSIDGEPAGADFDQYKELAAGQATLDDVAETEGYYAIPTPELQATIERRGKDEKAQLSKSTNLAFFLECAKKAGYPTEKLTADIRSLEGIYGSWSRLAQPDRKGLAKGAEDSGRPKQTLVLIEYKPRATSAKKSTASTAKKATPAAPLSTPADSSAGTPEDDFKPEFEAYLVELLADPAANKIPTLDDGVSVSRLKIMSAVVSHFPGGAGGGQKRLAINAMNAKGNGLLAQCDSFTYDPETDSLSLG